jgi:hydroxymethylpyrimidine/phosphomethylpyrimidine kinase
MKHFLTIAASDNSGGAGIQQDIKVASNHGYWVLSAITGITVQNFEHVFEVEPVNQRILKSQIEQCFQSFPVQAVKIGAICSEQNLLCIANCLEQYSPRHVVLDPVLFSTSGASFLGSSSLTMLKEKIFPHVELVTPNKPEFETLSNCSVKTLEEGIAVATEKCIEWGTSILLKGGHFDGASIQEALITERGVARYERKREIFPYNHGTGCTLSTALSCNLGRNMSLTESYAKSSEYLVNYFRQINMI